MPTPDEPEITIDQVEALGAKRLAAIVVDHAYRDAGLLQAVRMALAGAGPDDRLVDALAAESTAREPTDISMAIVKRIFGGRTRSDPRRLRVYGPLTLESCSPRSASTPPARISSAPCMRSQPTARSMPWPRITREPLPEMRR